ncbi:MAG: ATP-dependent helicase, partial [Phycisphaerae bacterium]|nr:ATP-dependent helicase [Phycisphaerae bacterium]
RPPFARRPAPPHRARRRRLKRTPRSAPAAQPEQPQLPGLDTPHATPPLDGLNDAQRRAVEHDAGPLLVLAGPGTGKTRVIVHRIAHIIRARGAEPESVLAVTFSNKAAAELRQRLATMLGPSLADRVRAHTFHSLGLGLIRRFPDLLGLPGQPTLIDRAQRRRLARTLIREHDLYRDALAQGRDAVLDEFDAHAEQFWNLGLTPATPPALDAFTRDWRHRLETAPPSDHLARDAELARCNRFTDHARLFTLLLRACRQRGWVSFGDLITLPIELLSRSSAARAIIRDETRHVVVDEYQDVNPAQIAFLSALAPPPPPDRPDLPGPDLCAVGDDDQAIYAFRGADDRAFPRFAQRYPRHTVIPLVENYRSVPAVLTASDRVIAGSHSRFRPDKHLRATRAPNPPAPGALPPVLAIKLAAELDDGPPIAALILTERARSAVANPPAPPRPWSDFAIIARTHGDLARIAAALELEGIPTAAKRAEGALGDPGVQDLLAWVDLLVEPRAVWSARRLIIRPPIGVPHDAALALEQAFHADARRHRLDDPNADTPGFAAWLRARLAEAT